MVNAKPNSQAAPGGSKPLKFLWFLTIVLVIAPAIGFIIIWSSLAITYAGTSGDETRWAFGASFAIVFSAAFVCFPKRRWTMVCLLAASGAVFWWWSNLKPSHDRRWSQLSAILPKVKIDGDSAEVTDIRNFAYDSGGDFAIRYYDKTYDLTKLKTLDLIISYWGDGRRTAHSMLSFGFDDQEYLCVSVEARAEEDEEYSGIAGMFRKYELIYVLGDEADLLGSRIGPRKEQVYLYPTRCPPADVRKLFEQIAARVNQIAEAPEFYNTIADNCTTHLARSGRSIVPPNSFDYRLLLNGYADEMAYDNGWIDTDLPFAKTRQRHHINRYIIDEFDLRRLSRRIRPHLRQPERPKDAPKKAKKPTSQPKKTE